MLPIIRSSIVWGFLSIYLLANEDADDHHIQLSIVMTPQAYSLYAYCKRIYICINNYIKNNKNKAPKTN